MPSLAQRVVGVALDLPEHSVTNGGDGPALPEAEVAEEKPKAKKEGKPKAEKAPKKEATAKEAPAAEILEETPVTETAEEATDNE